MAMRGVETRIQEIRHRIFTEVARMAYHTEWPTDRRIEALPYDIMPGEVGNIPRARYRWRTPASGDGSAVPQCGRACAALG